MTRSKPSSAGWGATGGAPCESSAATCGTPYVEAARTHLPHAETVFDRFHIVQHLNDALDTVRREAWRAMSGRERPTFKRTRFLWLKNPWNLEAA